jgi:hypothetical protein
MSRNRRPARSNPPANDTERAAFVAAPFFAPSCQHFPAFKFAIRIQQMWIFVMSVTAGPERCP